MLSSIGAFLVVNDSLGSADFLVLTPESDVSGQIEVADLYHDGLARSVLIFELAATSIDEELNRRGVRIPERTIDTLKQLGIPRAAMLKIDGGEGGTTATTQGLASWIRDHPGRRVIVIVAATHGRRYRRALLRVWPSEQPLPIVRASRHHWFRADDWWRSRRSLRNGLIEFQKLGVDYLRHPL